MTDCTLQGGKKTHWPFPGEWRSLGGQARMGATPGLPGAAVYLEGEETVTQSC